MSLSWQRILLGQPEKVSGCQLFHYQIRGRGREGESHLFFSLKTQVGVKMCLHLDDVCQMRVYPARCM